jgi:hypothetical protein
MSLSKHPAPAGRDFTSNFRKNTEVQRAYHKKEAGSGSVKTTTCFFVRPAGFEPIKRSM